MEIGNTATTLLEPVFNEAIQVQETPCARARTGSENISFQSGDTINVSHDAVLMTAAYQTANAATDSRAEKIAAIRARIADGLYEIDSKKIAASLIREEPGLFRLR